MKQNLGFHGEITYTPVKDEKENNNSKITFMFPFDIYYQDQVGMPKGEIKQTKSLIVGHSETGHHHVLECDTAFEQIMTDNGIYVRLEQEARLFHKKANDIHETRILQPGIYRFGEKTEYNPWTKAIQRVFD